MPRRRFTLRLLPVLALLACAGEGSEDAPGESEAEMEARARALHERVMTLDTHVDIDPGNFTQENSYGNRLDTQVDVTKMEEGGLDAAFLIVYVGQEDDLGASGFAAAHAAALAKFEAIHRLVTELAPDRIGLATTADEARALYADGKKVALIGVENGYPLGDDLDNVQKFAELGARYLSLAHNGHNQLSDSHTGEADGEWMHDGLSELGRQAVEELNRWGVMIDVSHPSKAAMMQMVELSRAPIVASHSAARALCDHSRNMDDEQLLALRENGGVIQTVAFNGYVKCQEPSAERSQALQELRQEFAGTGGPGAMTDEQRDAFRARMAEIDEMYPAPPRATVAEFVDHIDYLVDLIGVDHVGISSDFDGGGGVEGWMDATETFNVTHELVRRGYTDEEIEKVWSGNLLRVMEAARQVGLEMRGEA